MDTTLEGSERERSSKYRGVNKAKNKNIYSAHIYNNGLIQDRGRTVYLGTFGNEEDAARAYDLVSLKYWGSSAITNFPKSNYEEEVKVVAHMTHQEIVANLRRSSSRFARGKSIYRGVARQPGSRKWLANKGKCKGGSFLGTYDTEKEAAMAFDIATIKAKGFGAITNFDITLYNVEAILQGKVVAVEEEIAMRLKEETSLLGHLKKKERMKGVLEEEEDETSGARISRKEDPSGEKEDPSGEKTTMRGTKESIESSNLGFRHASCSAFQPYKPEKHEELGNVQNVIAIRPSFQALVMDGFWCSQFETSDEQEATRALGIGGFQHANSSCFKPYSTSTFTSRLLLD